MMWSRIFPLLLSVAQSSSPAPCSWGTAAQVGTLAPAITESSGMAISRKVRNRSYRINDSGDSGRFFLMDLDGRNAKPVSIEGFSPTDTEDMAIGHCGSNDCLFIGDIGDNARGRKTLELVVVRERANFPAVVKPEYRVRLQYPDGPHDAESLGVHPDGTIYIITKDATRSQLFRLREAQWKTSGNRIQTLEPVTTFEWPSLLPDVSGLGRLATAMDIAPDGKRFVVLTYTEAMEFFFDLSKPLPPQGAWREGRDYRRIPVTTLEQQEAIAYLPDGKGLQYDTEKALMRAARIYTVNCTNATGGGR